MENVLTQNSNSVALNNDLIDVTNTNLPHAIVTEVLLKNGKRTQIITLFNQNEINCEEIELGVKEGLQHNRETYSYKSSMCAGVKQGLLGVVSSTSWNTINHISYEYLS